MSWIWFQIYLGKMIVPNVNEKFFRLNLIILLVACAVCSSCSRTESPKGVVTYERLLKADEDAGNWLTYSGAYNGQRFSRLSQINRENVNRLRLKWVFPIDTPEQVETTPLVVDGVMYLTRPLNDVVALDAETGELLWEYSWPLPEVLYLAAGKVNRGVAILGETLYLGTLDAHLVALDAKTGKKKWAIQVADHKLGFSITHAPLPVKDMIITGTSLGGFGLESIGPDGMPERRGRIDAYDSQTGELRWRFYTVPGSNEPGNETWGGGFWKIGGSSTWMTGSYDPELNMVYWGVSSPFLWMFGEIRKGDNLYSASVVALNADTGKLEWYYQFTPHDTHDWDSAHVFVLADMEFAGRQRKILLNANRNGFFYVLDRKTGEFLLGKPYAKQTWADGIDTKGKPIVKSNIAPSYEGTRLSPNQDGATNWWSPSFSPNTELFYVTAHDTSEVYFIPKVKLETLEDLKILMDKITVDEAAFEQFKESFIRYPEYDNLVSTIRALSPKTGELIWEFRMPQRSTSGILTAAGDLLFTGSVLGDFWALDAFSGEILWHGKLDGWVHAAPITYLSQNQQLVSIASSKGIYTFGPGKKEDLRGNIWQLEVQGNNVASLVFPPEDTQKVRIEIEKAETDITWHIQLNRSSLEVRPDRGYALSFRARAEGRRTIVFGFAQAHEPWEGLGLYKEVEMTREWQDFYEEFTPTADEDNARIHFDLGGRDISVELSDVTLRSLQDPR